MAHVREVNGINQRFNAFEFLRMKDWGVIWFRFTRRHKLPKFYSPAEFTLITLDIWSSVLGSERFKS